MIRNNLGMAVALRFGKNRLGLDSQLPPIGHCLDSIQKQIEEYLLHLIQIHFYLWKCRIVFFHKDDSSIGDILDQQWRDLIDNILDVAENQVGPLGFGKGEKHL